MVNDEYADVTFALFALKAKGEPQRLLVRDAEALRQQLLHVAGVKKVNIIGEQPERIFVSFSHDRLATLGVTPQDIFAALNSQNVLTPAGSIETKGPGCLFVSMGRSTSWRRFGRPRLWYRDAR
jgi:multidrug efflux pump subunit AcrB